MKIPYGKSSFEIIRTRQLFYVDKTPFLPLLESDEAGYGYLIFLRPRRFGKSTLLSMLEHYYDIGRAAQFDALFGGLWAHDHPTLERNQYLVLTLDFSPVNTDGDAVAIQRSFTTTVKSSVLAFTMRYAARIPQLGHLEATLDSHHDAAGLMSTLLSIVGGSGHKLYLLIDEYDHFANRLPASSASFNGNTWRLR